MTETIVAEPLVSEPLVSEPPIAQAHYSAVSTICFVCGITAPGMDPAGWATWTRTSTALPYYLHTCPEHSTHEGLVEAIHYFQNSPRPSLEREGNILGGHLPPSSELSRLRAIILAAQLECRNTLTSRITNHHDYGEGLKQQATWVLDILDQVDVSSV